MKVYIENPPFLKLGIRIFVFIPSIKNKVYRVFKINPQYGTIDDVNR